MTDTPAYMHGQLFTDVFSAEDRAKEAACIRERYPQRVPVICERHAECTALPEMSKRKFLVPFDMTVGQFLYVIRKRLHVNANVAMFFFVGGTLPPNSALIRDVHNTLGAADGFLYVKYTSENAFGGSTFRDLLR